MLPSTFIVPFSSIRVKKNEQNLIGAAPSIVPLATISNWQENFDFAKFQRGIFDPRALFLMLRPNELS